MVRHMLVQSALANFIEIIDSVSSTNDPVVVEGADRPYVALISAVEFEEFTKYREAKAWEAIERLREANRDVDADEGLVAITSEIDLIRKDGGRFGH
jgi:PHD/YefM family antitoxin component YafN of YafNO toxin-antitoxin module